MVRFTVKFKEYLLAVPLVTVALAVTTLIMSSRLGFTDAVMCIICIQIVAVLFDFIVTILTFNRPVGMSAFAVIFILLYVVIGSSLSKVQYICLTCHNIALVVVNIVLMLHLLMWRITVENDGFSYRTLFCRKRFYKYSEVTKIEFFHLGYKVHLGNQCIRCYLQARNNDAFYEQIMTPNVPLRKIKF